MSKAASPNFGQEHEPLLERERELAAAVAWLSRARSGSGSVLVVEGPAGIGKTALLGAIQARAGDFGMEVLSACADELEREFAFGVVRLLFEQALRRAGAAERAALLDGAARFAAPVVAPGAGLATPELPPAWDAGPSILHGLYWLVSNMAERAPQLLVVDDAHWADAASLRFLNYLARRLGELPVGLVVGVRTAEPATQAELLPRLRAAAGAQLVRPGALSDAAVARFVRILVSASAEPEFCAACRTATGGNPFILRELARMIRSEGIEPTAAHAVRVGGMVPEVVARAVLVRLLRLPPAAVELARAIALLGMDADLRLAGALAGLDDDVAAEAADALTAADILAFGRPLTFVHPIMQEVISADTPPAERAIGHSRAARLLAGAGRPADRVATQLLESEPGGGDWAVGVLRDAAHAALGRGSPELAARYLGRALAEPTAAPLHFALLRDLGAAQARAGHNAAVETLTRAMDVESEPRARAEIAVTLARALGMIGEHGRAIAILARAADEAADSDEDFALRVQAEWITVARLHRATRQQARGRSAHLRTFARPPRPATSLLLANLTLDALEDGQPAQLVADLATDALTGGWLLDEESFGFAYAANTLIWIDEYELAERAWQAAREAAQRRGSAALFALVSGWRCQLAYRRGALQEAEAEGQIAVRLVDEHEWHALRGYPHAHLSDAVMERGDYPAAEALLVGDADTEHIPFFLNSRGRLRCLLGHFAEGLEDFLRCGEALDARGGRDSPGIIPWRSNAAIAYDRLEEPDRARPLAAEELKLAQACGAARAIGIGLRALGIVEDGERGIERLEAAVGVLERSEARLELARALIDLGAALRRSRQRERARDPLRRGLDLAHRCGAHALADRAQVELLSTGARPRRVVLSGVDSLTPSERRIAELAGEGMTNRQIAQSLFISMKTVAVHLTHTYQKLEIDGRTELSEIVRSASVRA